MKEVIAITIMFIAAPLVWNATEAEAKGSTLEVYSVDLPDWKWSQVAMNGDGRRTGATKTLNLYHLI